VLLASNNLPEEKAERDEEIRVAVDCLAGLTDPIAAQQSRRMIGRNRCIELAASADAH
jgi:dGTP triphosphohydrolase